ncbi:MAG: hypothetical protein WBB85_22000 [Albidovulum sp.]|uniref:fascin domain-containing protein n=1 Tax=Albidovulum sp. TaxID=1872424 RepID=UPI003CAFCF58
MEQSKILTANSTITAYGFASAAFANAYIRMDGQGITQGDPAGAGIVNAQIGMGPWEQYSLTPQANGTFGLVSRQWDNVAVRMGDRMIAEGQRLVNCQFGVGPYETYKLLVTGPNLFTFESTAHAGWYLALDTEGQTKPNGVGVGKVYGTQTLDAKAQFQFIPGT